MDFILKNDVLKFNKELIRHLNKREQNILLRRFGLEKPKKATLESIGKDHDLTRERIRQLENVALRKIKEKKELEEKIKILEKDIQSILAEYSGFLDRDYLLDQLAFLNTSKEEWQNLSQDEKNIKKNNFDFLLSRIVNENLEKIENSKIFNTYLKPSTHNTEHFEEIGNELKEKLEKIGKILTSDEILELFYNLEKYKLHAEKLKTPDQVNLIETLNHFSTESGEKLHNHKVAHSILKAAKDIDQSKLGYWGLKQWSAIKPKTVSDKIFLVLEKFNRPMHFQEITDKINEIGFDEKKANSATVHNELILNDRYVLIGRGVYALTKWNKKDA